jgi:hypothetical protein
LRIGNPAGRTLPATGPIHIPKIVTRAVRKLQQGRDHIGMIRQHVPSFPRIV